MSNPIPASTPSSTLASSPLATDPQSVDSISELFSRDPMEWTDEDLMRSVTYLREQRLKLDTATQKPKSRAAAPKIDVSNKDVGDLLKELGLD